MIVVPPLNLSTSFGQIGANDPNVTFNIATTYNLGDVVKNFSASRLYKSLIASNVGHPIPSVIGTSNTQWADDGPTNAYEMLNYTANTQCVATGDTMTITIGIGDTLGIRLDTIGLTGVDADTVELQVNSSLGSNPLLLDVTEVLYSRTVIDWYDYFYKAFRFRTICLFENLPQSLTNFYTLIFNTSSRPVKCGALIAGVGVYLGEAQYDPTLSQINFSTITADNFGNTVLIPKRSVPNNTILTTIPAINVDDAIAVRDLLNATPALWSGLDDDTQPYFGGMLMFGVYTQFDFDPFSIDYATLTLQIQGF